MGQNFIADTVNQTLLFPPSLHDWLPEGHLARFLLDVVSTLDLNGIYTSYQEKDGRGQAAYAPEMMVRLLLYGYRYALSAGGMFLGKTVLGDFFTKNRGLSREEVLHNAISHFREFQNLVRPVMAPSNTIEDTANDRIVYMCEGSCRWAFLIFIRTGGLAHVVMVPQMESPDAAARFVSFLNERGSKFQARRCYFDGDAFQATTPISTADK